MQYRLTASIALALSLTACAPHPPLRYIERHYHHAPVRPYFAESYSRRSGGYHNMDPYVVRELYYSGYERGPLEGTQMRSTMERANVMYGHGCYVNWC